MTWATQHYGSLEGLKRVQGSLTVDLIMVPRAYFMTCSLEDTAKQVKARNTAQFSYVPVANSNERILGLYHAERWFSDDAPDTLIGDDYQSLSEDIVIGADASIFHFIMQADTNPTNLVVSGNKIAGLVSLSDLQQLPVRASLFALITSLEMVMAMAIEKRWPKSSDWIGHLGETRRDKLSDEIAIAQKNDSFVSAISFTQFADKADLIRTGKILTKSGTSLKREFSKTQSLRDNLAHANSYANTSDAAKNVCATVRTIYELKNELLNTL